MAIDSFLVCWWLSRFVGGGEYLRLRGGKGSFTGVVEQAPFAEAWRILSSLTTQMDFEYRPMLLQEGGFILSAGGPKLS